MAVKLNDYCTSAGGKIGYVFHVAGMDYAFTSSTELAAALPTGSATSWIQNMRRAMFGNLPLSISGSSYYPADDVPLLPNLSKDLGAQVTKYDEKKGIDVGSWSVTVSDNMQGLRRENYSVEPLGLPGIRWLKDPWADTTIKSASLQKDYNGGVLYFERATAGFITWLNAQQTANSPIYLWSSSSCIGISDNAVITDNGDGSGEIATTVRGQYQTPLETIWRDTGEDVQQVQIYSAPVEGLVGLPCYLWGIFLDDDGNVLDQATSTPVLLRIGKVNTNPSGAPGEWKISCSGLTSMLKKKIVPKRMECGLHGYTFAAPTTLHKGNSTYHICVREYNAGSQINGDDDGTYLCSAGDSIRFETLNEVKAAVKDKLNDLTAATTLDFDYLLDEEGDLVFNCDAGTYPTPEVEILGIAAAVCGFGYITDDQTEFVRKEAGMIVPPWGYYSTVDSASVGRVFNLRKADGEMDPYDYDRNPSAAKYLYQCDYEDETYIGNSKPSLPIPDGYTGIDAWQVPNDSSNNRKLYVDSESDTRNFSVGDMISVGDGREAKFSYVYDTGFKTRRLVGKIASIDSTDGRWLTLDTPGGDYSSYGTGVLSEIPEFAHDISANGLNLCYMPRMITENNEAVEGDSEDIEEITEEEDCWPVLDLAKVTSSQPSLIFRALLGDTATGISVPRRAPITNVPFVRASDALTLIDWATFDDLVSQAGLSGSVYTLLTDEDAGETKTYLQLLNAVCVTNGMRMVWEYNESQRSKWISFAPLLAESAMTAVSSGRVLDETTIKNTKPSYTIGADWIYSSVEYKGRKDDGKKFKHTILHATDRQQDNANAATLQIDDQVTNVSDGDLATLQQTLLKLARYSSVPSYAQKLQCDIKKLATISCGRYSLLTWSAGIDISTGSYGITEKPVLITEERITLGPNPGVGLTVRMTQRPNLGISPSLFLDASSITQTGTPTVINLSSLSTSVANNKFFSTAGGLTDLAGFDCYQYNPGTGTVALNTTCGCSDYAVIMFRRNVSQYYDSGASRNVFHGTIGTIDITAGTAVVTLDDATNFDETKDHVLIFELRTDSGLQSCQTVYYGNLGDDEGITTDSGANDYRAIAWG
jgi:hypothetical protein